MHELSLSNIFWEFIKKCNMGSYEMHWWKVCKILRNPVARMGKLKMGGLGSTNVELSIHNIMYFLQKYTIKGIHGKFEYGDA